RRRRPADARRPGSRDRGGARWRRHRLRVRSAGGGDRRERPPRARARGLVSVLPGLLSLLPEPTAGAGGATPGHPARTRRLAHVHYSGSTRAISPFTVTR